MALNLYQERVRNQLVNDIKKLKALAQQSRADQTLVLTYGTIQLDGGAGTITIKDGSDNIIVGMSATGIVAYDTSENDIVSLDATGIAIKDTSGNSIVKLNTSGIVIKAINASDTRYIRFQSSTSQNVGTFVYQRYTNAGTEVSDFSTRTYLSASNQKDAYVTMDIYANNETTRTLFLQIYESYDSSGVFSGARMNFSKHGYTTSFSVYLTDATGGGYVKFPHLTADPSPMYQGCIYYNSSTGKLRKLNNGTWSDV